MESIFTRRSIRKYEEKVVEKDKIEKLLRAAMQAPSAGNQQPWEFLVVENKETLGKLSEISPYATMLKEAPLAIIVLSNEEKMKFPEYWQQDLGAATQNILLEAVELGLGAVWLGVAPLKDREDFIRKIFNLPHNITPFNIIVLGYPKDPQINKFVDRYEENRVHFEKY